MREIPGISSQQQLTVSQRNRGDQCIAIAGRTASLEQRSLNDGVAQRGLGIELQDYDPRQDTFDAVQFPPALAGHFWTDSEFRLVDSGSEEHFPAREQALHRGPRTLVGRNVRPTPEINQDRRIKQRHGTASDFEDCDARTPPPRPP